MPQVYRIDQGEKTLISISDDIWKKIQKKPNVFGKYKWELAPKPKLPKPKFPVYKPPVVDDDLAEKPTKPIYTENDYREDLKNARLALKSDLKDKALLLYQQAFIFKESPYVKGQIKKLL